jgi:hypothetical protein
MTPDHPDVLRLRPYREAHRPSGCTGAMPCWVIDPYGAIPVGKGAARCVTCHSRIWVIPTLDELTQRSEPRRGTAAP